LDVANTTLADRIYYLNKALNGLDLFYEVEMPDVFYLDHPVGTVIG
jgi:serine O-acetyltransferase